MGRTNLGLIAESFPRVGVHSFALLPREKRPATRRGVDAATTDLAKIRGWWRVNPSFNVGIATGPSGLVVLDLDAGKPWPLPTPPPPGVVDGSDMSCFLAEEHGQDAGALFDTASVMTPSGGRHLYYRAPTGRAIGNSAGKLGPWIDVRGRGGYVVAPWSVLPNGRYEPIHGFDWLPNPAVADIASAVTVSGQPWRQTLPELPTWVADLLDPPRPAPDPYRELAERLDRQASSHPDYLESALDGECARVLAAKDGVRNFTLNRAAFALGTLAEAGLDKRTVESRLLAAALHIGLGEKEANATIESGFEAGAANPREIAS